MSTSKQTVPVVIKTEKVKPEPEEVESVCSSSESLGSQDTESEHTEESESEYEEEEQAEQEKGEEVELDAEHKDASFLRTLFSSLVEGSGEGIEVGEATTKAPWGLNRKLKIEAEVSNTKKANAYKNMAIGGVLGVLSGFVYSLVIQ